jgi:hypothetical protein
MVTAIAPIPTTTTIIPSTATAMAPSNISFTITVTADNSTSPSGQVTLTVDNIDGSSIGTGTGTLSGGSTTISYAFPTAGTFAVTASYQGNGPYLSSTSPPVNVQITSACIHANSLVLTTTNQSIAISELVKNDAVIGADGQSYRIEEVVPCWLKLPDELLTHDCIVFEKDSLGLGLPTENFIVDVGHPICLPDEYRDQGISALKPSRLYYSSSNPGTILCKYADVEKGLRYDLILDQESCGAYMANGICVKARISVAIAGYDHRE